MLAWRRRRGAWAVWCVVALCGACRGGALTSDRPASSIGGATGAGAVPVSGGAGSAQGAGGAQGAAGAAGMTAGDPPAGAQAQPRLCEEDAWCWYNPLPQGRGLTAVWASSATDVWAGVDARTAVFLHRDASRVWTRVATGLAVRVEAIWGSSPRSVWAVGARTDVPLVSTILHWDGATWTEAYRADDALLHAIAGSGPNDVWAIGSGAHGFAYHFDGAAWTVDAKATAFLTPLGGQAARISARAPNDVWLATNGALLHFDGRAWTVDHTDQTAYVNDVWATGPNDAFRTVTRTKTVGVDRWNGSTWSASFAVSLPPVPSPEGSWQQLRIDRVRGRADDLWTFDTSGTAYHFDGVVWGRFTTGARAVMTDIWVDGGTALAVGQYGEMLEVAGYNWRRITTGTSAFLYAIHGSGPDDVWFGGAPTALISRVPHLLHWDGRAIRGVSLPTAAEAGDAYGAPNGVTTVWAPDPSTVWIGGLRGLLARRHGDDPWQTFAMTTDDIQQIWGAAADDGWLLAASPAREAFRWQGDTWTSAPLPPDVTADPAIVWTNAPDDVWAVRTTPYTSELQHFDGTTWTTVRSFYQEGIGSAWSPGPNEVYTSGDRLHHYKNGAWTDLDTPPIHVWGTASGDAWAIAQDGSGAILRH